MKKLNIKTIIILIILLTLIIIGIIITTNKPNKNNIVKNKKSEVTYKENPGIIEDKTINNILFTDIKCFIENDNTTINYVIKNNNDTSITLNDYELIFKDENNNIIGIVYTNTPTTIEANDSLNVENTATINLEKATSMELKLKEK